MSYDKKHVTTSFREALGKCIATGQGKSLEELHKMPRGAKLEEPVEEVQQLDEDQVAEEELEAVELDEAEFIAELEEEMSPHILKLIGEGFSDAEIEDIILEMLMADDEEIEDEDEQLDEISKKKLGRYMKKATASLNTNSGQAGTLRGTITHARYPRLSHDDRLKYDIDQESAHKRTVDKRGKGIFRAIDRLTKEEEKENKR